MLVTPSDLLRWGADFTIADQMEPRALAALPEAPRDLVWVLAHAVAEAYAGDAGGTMGPLEIVRDVAKTSASAAALRAAPGEPGWREAVAAEDRRQIEQMVQMLEGA